MACFLLIEYPDSFYEGRCVVDTDHEVYLLLEVEWCQHLGTNSGLELDLPG
ncbi:MAG: hypothetical protein O7B35_11495 [Deltaproteobacteria bacterium]|nr:hypothetical protein [Deltaproteobacteria bacterium]